MRRLAAFLLVLMAAVPGPRDMTVDCDAGGDLAGALRKAKRFPGTTIRVRGTCTGTFTVAAKDIRLRGDPSGSTVIEGPRDAIANRLTVLDVTVDRFIMSDLTVRGGWIGVHLRGGISTNSNVFISDSSFEDNYGGVLIDSGSFARVETSTFLLNQVGVSVLFNSQGSIADCDIRDSGILGIDVYDDSIAAVQRTSVSGSGGIGMAANLGSFLGINDATLADNDELHLLVQDRSKLRLGRTTVGSDTDATPFALFIDDASILRSFGTEWWGDVLADGAVHLSIGDDKIHGSMFLEDFTQANLSRTTLDGVVECSSGSDAFCDSGTTASVSGCASAASPCTVAAAPAVETPRGRPEWAGNDLRESRSGWTTQEAQTRPTTKKRNRGR